MYMYTKFQVPIKITNYLNIICFSGRQNVDKSGKFLIRTRRRGEREKREMRKWRVAQRLKLETSNFQDRQI